MNTQFHVIAIKTPIIYPGDDLTACLCDAAGREGGFQDGDILVIAESALATAEGGVVRLSDVTPSPEAERLGTTYAIDPRLAQIVLQESDSIAGGIPGHLLCFRNGTLLPNAGVDDSNAPPGTVVLLPKNPDKSATRIRLEIQTLTDMYIGVIVADSRTHAMRLGCSGVAIGASGFCAVGDERGKADLFGRPLQVTRSAIADNIASAAELVMGEADECIPAAIVRGLGLPINEEEGIEGIEASECLFMGSALNGYPARICTEQDTGPLKKSPTR